MMSLTLAAVVLSTALPDGSSASSQSRASDAVSSANASESAAAKSARDWIALVDGERWEESWRSAGTLFKSQLTAEQ